ncbi:MAG TPA: ribulose-phosphate 3-epimerase [Gaiellaceae bacterium]|nr:ribulose-phosphate 3-epimerase [Gaiellaceae bacterium]
MSWSEWMRGAEIEPSLYGADFARLGAQVGELVDSGCRIFHFDIGDGHFVEPITMGPIVLQSISSCNAMFDVHLMVENPVKYFEPVKDAGGDSVTFHFEAVDDVPATIAAAHAAGLDAGVAFNPESEPEAVAAVSADADIVLCMSIHPGYSGQPFMDRTFERVGRLRAVLPDHIQIQVDGGVGAGNVEQLRECGVSLFVAASSIFGAGSPAAAYDELERLIR